VAGCGRLGTREADKRGQTATGPGGQWWGAGGRGENEAARRRTLADGPGSTVPAGQVLNPIQTESKIFKMVQMDLKKIKLWPTQNVSSRAPKM
jgi:hypothetical protein